MGVQAGGGGDREGGKQEGREGWQGTNEGGKEGWSYWE